MQHRSGMLVSPRGIVECPDGTVVVAEQDSMRLRVLSVDGTVLRQLAMPANKPVAQRTPNGFFGVTVDWRGRIYASVPDHKAVWCFCDPTQPSACKVVPSMSNELIWPAGVDVDEGARLLAIADQKGAAVFLVDISAALPSEARLVRRLVVPTYSPYSIAFDRRGHNTMNVSCVESGALFKLTTQGVLSTVGHIPGARTLVTTEQGIMLCSTAPSKSSGGRSSTGSLYVLEVSAKDGLVVHSRFELSGYCYALTIRRHTTGAALLCTYNQPQLLTLVRRSKLQLATSCPPKQPPTPPPPGSKQQFMSSTKQPTRSQNVFERLILDARRCRVDDKATKKQKRRKRAANKSRASSAMEIHVRSNATKRSSCASSRPSSLKTRRKTPSNRQSTK